MHSIREVVVFLTNVAGLELSNLRKVISTKDRNLGRESLGIVRGKRYS